MCKTDNCYRECMNQNFLMLQKLLTHAQEIISQLKTKSSVGRLGIESDRGLNGIFYTLRTGIQWNASPRCFGSCSAVHRFFQQLRTKGFFDKLWHIGISTVSSLSKFISNLRFYFYRDF